MAIASLTDVSNLALSKIGARRINTYETDTSPEANSCRLHLPLVIDTLLERHQWDFATARAELSKLAGTPIGGEWSSEFQLPADFIRLIRIPNGDPSQPVRSFAREGRKILIRGGGPTLPLVYVTNAVPVPIWPALFVDAVVYKLASSIANDIPKNAGMSDSMLQKLEALALPAAQLSDARQTLSGENFGPREMAARSPLVAARFRADGNPPYIPMA